MKTPMKAISYRGGLVEFQIPMHWCEKYQSEGGGEFWDPNGGSGTLRLNVITAKMKEASRQQSAADVLRAIKKCTTYRGLETNKPWLLFQR